MDPYGETAAQYDGFAREARDSPCFVAWAEGVRDDPEVLAWIERLPGLKRQPNLVFAAARWHGVPAPGPYAVLREALLGDDGTIRATILERSTQTNEAGRLATLTPAFATVAGDRPLALVEAGASAGLCLHPDRWSYRWQTDEGDVTAGSGPELTCRVTGALPGVEVPEVAWRGGVDLHPLDVTDDDTVAWLEVLVWPEHDDRRDRLRQAVEVARADPPEILAGDLLTDLPDLVDRAAAGAPGAAVVVFHSAVIAYLTDEDRRRFHALMTGLVAEGRCHWVSNESPHVLPELVGTEPHRRGLFALAVDGRLAGWTHGHGRSLDWRPTVRPARSATR